MMNVKSLGLSNSSLIIPHSSLLIDSHVVNEHRLREGGRLVGVAGLCAADGEVEQDEERVVVNPLRARGQIRGRARLVEVAVNVPANRCRFPLDREGVEVVGERALRLSGDGRTRRTALDYFGDLASRSAFRLMFSLSSMMFRRSPPAFVAFCTSTVPGS